MRGRTPDELRWQDVQTLCSAIIASVTAAGLLTTGWDAPLAVPLRWLCGVMVAGIFACEIACLIVRRRP